MGFLSEIDSMQVFFSHLCYAVGDSITNRWLDHIIMLYFTIFECLSQIRTWNFNVICCGSFDNQ